MIPIPFLPFHSEQHPGCLQIVTSLYCLAPWDQFCWRIQPPLHSHPQKQSQTTLGWEPGCWEVVFRGRSGQKGPSYDQIKFPGLTLDLLRKQSELLYTSTYCFLQDDFLPFNLQEKRQFPFKKLQIAWGIASGTGKAVNCGCFEDYPLG